MKKNGAEHLEILDEDIRICERVIEWPPYRIFNVIFQVPKRGLPKIRVFWDITSWRLVESYRNFEG
jgi:hypothetical protein